MEQAHVPAYRLVRRPVPTAPAARLDEAQQAVVDHAGGPLLVLAGPGTGKTTTIVAAALRLKVSTSTRSGSRPRPSSASGSPPGCGGPPASHWP